MIPAIEARGLTKTFGPSRAVDQVDLDISAGEVFGFLGPNGAGKTTTIRLLAGIMEPTSGDARVLGFSVVREPENVKRHIGYVAQAFGLYGDLTVDENLKFYASLYGAADTMYMNELVERYGFAEHRRKLARDLSGGYRTRLALITALAHHPRLLFLDEPTAGVDPVTRKELWDLFYELKGGGTTLFVTTHYMEEAERCDRLAFIYRGRLVAAGPPNEMKEALTDRDVFEVETVYKPEIVEALRALPRVETFNQFGSVLRVILARDAGNHGALCGALGRCGIPESRVRTGRPTMEDVFVCLTHAMRAPMDGLSR